MVAEIIVACEKDATRGNGGAIFTPEQVDRVALGHNKITLAAKTGATALAVWEAAPADFFLSADVTLAPGTTLSFLLRGNPQDKHPGRSQPSPLDDSYALTLDGHTQQVILHRNKTWGRMPVMRCQTIEFPVDRPFKIYLMLHNDVLEVFVDDRISLCARMQLPTGALALLARDGRVSLDNLRITKLPLPSAQ